MEGIIETAPTTHYFDTLVKWLGLRDPQKNRAARTLLCRLGTPATPLLVQEAIRPGTRAGHVIAILDVVQQIGGPFGPDELFGLQSLLRHRNRHVVQAAEQIIMSASPCGPPDSPESAALMRAFNPFLTPPPRCRPRRTRTADFAAALRGNRAAGRRRVRSSVARQKREERELGRRT